MFLWCSEPCGPVWWQDLAYGPWWTVLLMALSWLLHSAVASSPCAAPFPAREKFPVHGNSLFPGKVWLCWHRTVPFNILQTLWGGQLSSTYPGNRDGSLAPPSTSR